MVGLLAATSVNRVVRRIKMYQGLGEAYINVFLWITGCGFVAAIVCDGDGSTAVPYSFWDGAY